MSTREFYLAAWSIAKDYPVEGEHEYTLPVVECPTCKDSRSASGFWYPGVDSLSLFNAKALARMRKGLSLKDCDWEEYSQYAQTLRQQVDSRFPLPPGAQFGKFKGKLFGRFEDFVMPWFHTILATRSAVERLQVEGFKFDTYEVELRSRNPNHNLVELWVPPVGLSVGAELCATCERGDTAYEAPVRSGSIPEDAHLVRLKNNPNFLVFSAELVNTIGKLGLKGLTFEKLAVE